MKNPRKADIPLVNRWLSIPLELRQLVLEYVFEDIKTVVYNPKDRRYTRRRDPRYARQRLHNIFLISKSFATTEEILPALFRAARLKVKSPNNLRRLGLDLPTSMTEHIHTIVFDTCDEALYQGYMNRLSSLSTVFGQNLPNVRKVVFDCGSVEPWCTEPCKHDHFPHDSSEAFEVVDAVHHILSCGQSQESANLDTPGDVIGSVLWSITNPGIYKWIARMINYAEQNNIETIFTFEMPPIISYKSEPETVLYMDMRAKQIPVTFSTRDCRLRSTYRGTYHSVFLDDVWENLHEDD